MQNNNWPEPVWIDRLSEIEREKARVRFYLNLAASYFSEDGTLTNLSEGAGFSATAINAARKRGRVSPDLANKIEAALGRDLFPRELFNPVFISGK